MNAAAPLIPLGSTSAAKALPALVFTEVYREYFGFVFRSAGALGVRPGSIDDVVQDVFVVVHRKLNEFEGRSTVRTWISQILVNVVRGHRRTRSRKSPHDFADHGQSDPESLASPSPTPYDAAATTERARCVQRLLDKLDDEKREVLVLAEIEELSVPEIAEALGLNVHTTASRLRLARQAFDAALSRDRIRHEGGVR